MLNVYNAWQLKGFQWVQRNFSVSAAVLFNKLFHRCQSSQCFYVGNAKQKYFMSQEVIKYSKC